MSYRTREVQSRSGLLVTSTQDETCTIIAKLALAQPATSPLLHPDFQPAGVYFAPVNYDNYIVYWGHMPVAGTLLEISWLHAHSHVYQKGLLIKGPPEEAGFTPAMMKEVTHTWCVPTNTSEKGFASNYELEQHIYRSLNASKTASLVMRATGALEQVGDYVADRRTQIEVFYPCTPLLAVPSPRHRPPPGRGS